MALIDEMQKLGGDHVSCSLNGFYNRTAFHAAVRMSSAHAKLRIRVQAWDEKAIPPDSLAGTAFPDEDDLPSHDGATPSSER